MESVVPAQITTELTQILSNLVLGDNEIRSKYASLPHDPRPTDMNAYFMSTVQRKSSTNVLLRPPSSIFWRWRSLQRLPTPMWYVLPFLCLCILPLTGMTDAFVLARTPPPSVVSIRTEPTPLFIRSLILSNSHHHRRSPTPRTPP